MPPTRADSFSYMRLTVTLDEDIATGVKSEMERSGQSFKQVVNRLLRLGFGLPAPPTRKEPKAGPVRGRRDRESP